MKKIFVNVCSYRDKLLLPTIESLIENESGRNEIVKAPDLVKKTNIRYKRIDPEFSDGVVWARSINSMQIYEEEFQYQIDSHMLFDKGWDHYLILDYLHACKVAGHDRVLLTCGTKNFDLDGDRITKHTLTDDISVNLGYYQFDKNMRLHAHGPWVPARDVVSPSRHICAGNFFAPAKWVKEVGYNTNIFFEGEEQMFALTSFLKGYSIYHMRRAKVYHYLRSANHETKQTVNPVVDARRLNMNKKRSEKELSNFIYSVDEAKLEEFRKHTGVDYINRKLEERAISRHIKPDVEIDWEIPNKE